MELKIFLSLINITCNVVTGNFRFGRRKVILAAMVLMIPVRLMTAFAVNYTMYVVAYALSGTFTLYIYLVSFVLSEYKNMSLQT